MRLVVRFTIETLTPLLRTQPFKPSLAKAMAWAGSMKPKIVVMTRKKDSATTDGMSSVRLPTTHISELLVRRKGHAMGVSTDGNGRR